MLAYLPDVGEVHGIEPIETIENEPSTQNEERGQTAGSGQNEERGQTDRRSVENSNSEGELAADRDGSEDAPPADDENEAENEAAEREPPAPRPIIYRDIARPDTRYKLCNNSSRYGVCNAALPADSAYTLCEACALNTIIPDLREPGALEAWQAIERAKRRLIYTLRELKLPIGTDEDDLPIKLSFSFMRDSPDGSTKVLTGHDAGHITLNIAEADAPFREKLRVDLGEGYRTLLGHFRHEIGHFYWDALVKDGAWLEAFRANFGDESQDYGAALKRHYESGPPFNWHERYVSAYATMHPWEDWAETWAHYLHIVDTLDTARSYGVSIQVGVTKDVKALSATPSTVNLENFTDLLAAWVPLTVTLNSLNRSMGLNDPYPFVLSEAIARKLHFVHDVIYSTQAREAERDAAVARAFDRVNSSSTSPSLLPGRSNEAAEQQSTAVEPDETSSFDPGDSANPGIVFEAAS